MAPRTLLRAVIEASGLSRRRSFEAIRAGRVRSDDVIVLDPSAPYDGSPLQLDGTPIANDVVEKVYLLLNKPPGILTTVSDDRGRPTVLDLIPGNLRVNGLHPVGRLDRDTTGLLLLTNDGDFTYHLTHPSQEIEKEYWLSAAPSLTDADIRRLRRGVMLDGETRTPVAVSRLRNESPYDLSITLREGRKRQVRRMVATLGSKVIRLKRVRESGLSLGHLPEGSVRRLTDSDLRRLKQDEP